MFIGSTLRVLIALYRPCLSTILCRWAIKKASENVQIAILTSLELVTLNRNTRLLTFIYLCCIFAYYMCFKQSRDASSWRNYPTNEACGSPAFPAHIMDPARYLFRAYYITDELFLLVMILTTWFVYKQIVYLLHKCFQHIYRAARKMGYCTPVEMNWTINDDLTFLKYFPNSLHEPLYLPRSSS